MRSNSASDEFNVSTFHLNLEGIDEILGYINQITYNYEAKYGRRPRGVLVPCKIYMAINLSQQNNVPLYMDGTVTTTRQLIGLNLLPTTCAFISLVPDDRDVVHLVTADMDPEKKNGK